MTEWIIKTEGLCYNVWKIIEIEMPKLYQHLDYTSENGRVNQLKFIFSLLFLGICCYLAGTIQYLLGSLHLTALVQKEYYVKIKKKC